MKKYPLALPSWDKEDYDSIKDVVNSGNFTMGSEVQSAEKFFANYFGSKYCVMSNSGSSANLLAIASHFFKKRKRWVKGMEVIVPAIGWSTTYYPIHQYNLKLVFVDVDLDTLNIDISKIENAISNKTVAIMAVNLLGNPCQFDELLNLSKKYNLEIIEDNCESMGAKFNDKYCGSIGKIGTFSSFFSHHISTMEGGYCITDNEELYHIMLSLRAHGWTRNLPNRNKVSGVKSKDIFKESWNFVLPGYNLRPLEMSGALCKSQMKKLNDFISQRRNNALIFKKHADDFSEFFRTQKEISMSSWFGFSMIFESESLLVKVKKAFSESNIEFRPIVTGNFTNKKVMKYLNYRISGNLTNSNKIDKLGLFIGNHHVNLKENIKFVFDVIKPLVK